VSANYDYFFDERLFIRPIDGEYYRDRFQNISSQVTIGAGIGYKMVDTAKIDWEIQVGPAYQFTKFSQVERGSDQTVQSPALVLSTTFEYNITSDLDYSLSYQGVLTNRESGFYTQHLVTSLDYELTSLFNVFLLMQFDRVENPEPRGDGSTPRKNDLTLSVGLGVDI
jgi:putative salt-induced outer membrane protein YdiY